MILLALARPQYIEPPVQKTEPGRDLMLALDISQSMETPDFRTPDGKRLRRVDAVKQVVADFIKARPHDRIGLIVFGQQAFPATPFTLTSAFGADTGSGSRWLLLALSVSLGSLGCAGDICARQYVN